MKHTFRHEKIKEGGKSYDMIFANEHPFVVGEVIDMGAEVWDKCVEILEDNGKPFAFVDGRKDFAIIGAGTHQRVVVTGNVLQEMKDTLKEMAHWWAEQNPHEKSIWDMDEGVPLDKYDKK